MIEAPHTRPGNGRARHLIVAVCATFTIGPACGHAPPRPTPAVRVAEKERLDRLPDDTRTLDGTWDDVRVQVVYKAGRAQAILELRHPKLRFFKQPAAADAPATAPSGDTDASKKISEGKSPPNPSRTVPETLRRMAPFEIDRIEIYDAEVVFVDMTKPARPELWLSELEVSIENVASRAGMAEGRPVLITARAKVQHSGNLALFVSADPWSEDLNFSGRASIEGLATKELYSFLADAAKVQMPKGSLDMYLAFTAKGGHITGGVKPILKNAEVFPVRNGVMARLTAWAADTILSIYSDRVKDRNAVATVVPIHGELASPKVELWSAIAGVLYNAYLDGLSAGFGGVPSAKGLAGTVAAAPAAQSAGVSQGEERRLAVEGREKGHERRPEQGLLTRASGDEP